MASDKKIAKFERKLANPSKYNVSSRRDWDEDCEFEVPAGTTLFVQAGYIEVTGDGVVYVGDAVVRASGDLRVIAGDSARVFADDHVQVLASSRAAVDLDGYASVSASDEVVVYADGYGDMRVVADDNVVVHANGEATVLAKGNTHVFSLGATVTATDSATVSGDVKAGTEVPSRLTSRTVKDTYVRLGAPVEEWCAKYGIPIVDGILHVYKGVGYDGMSEAANEHTGLRTEYGPGLTAEATDWNAAVRCGGGLHFSPSVKGTLRYCEEAARWFRCAVRADEVVVLGDKIKAKRVVEPMVEVDLFGEPTTESDVPPSTF